jgi:O-methyltransferase involved in polyketide biosynthesis
MASTMALDDNNIPPSALYTAATWRWGDIECADLVTPPNAARVFHVVNAGSFLYRLVNPRWHSLRHTLLHRHRGIDHLLRQSGIRHVIEIAAGFSPRGIAVSADSAMEYFEVDLPPLMAAKRQLLATTSAGQQVLSRPNLTLIEGDICALDWSRFEARPSFIITEGLMMYFDRATQMKIWKDIARFLSRNRGEYVFDYLPVPDEPPRSSVGHLLSRLHGQHRRRTFPCDGRTRYEIAADLHMAGFEHVDMHGSLDFASAWNLPHAGVNTRVSLYRCRC